MEPRGIRPEVGTKTIKLPAVVLRGRRVLRLLSRGGICTLPGNEMFRKFESRIDLTVEFHENEKKKSVTAMTVAGVDGRSLS